MQIVGFPCDGSFIKPCFLCSIVHNGCTGEAKAVAGVVTGYGHHKLYHNRCFDKQFGKIR